MQVGTSPTTNIKLDLDLDQTKFGLVTGSVFTFTNGITGLFFGHLSDKYNRKWPLFVSAILWTLSSLSISYCSDFKQVLLARISFAIFMSCCVPVSVSLICDYVIPTERGRAQSFFAAGIYLGVGLSSLSQILDEAVGWRSAVRFVALICGCVALLLIPIKEPKRNETNVELLTNR